MIYTNWKEISYDQHVWYLLTSKKKNEKNRKEAKITMPLGNQTLSSHANRNFYCIIVNISNSSA